MSDEDPRYEQPLVPPGAPTGPSPDPGGAVAPSGLPPGRPPGPPPAPPSGPPWGPPPPGAFAPPGPYGGQPLHKPGTVPLRPLTLSDFFDAAFTTVRRNPRTTIGMGALVTAGFMVVPIVASVLIGLGGGLDGALRPDPASTEPGAGTFVLYAVSSISAVFGLLANVVVAGLVVPVVTRAAIGEKVSGAAAWQQVRGRLWRLIGLAVLELVIETLLVTLVTAAGAGLGYAADGAVLAIVLGVVFFLLGLLGAIAVHVKWFQLAAPNLVVERRGVLGAISRGGRLSGGSFWRILGVVVLTAILTGVVGQIIGLPFTLIGTFLGLALPERAGPVSLLIASNLSAIVAGAVVAPFSGTVAVLQYLDQRFRREGFDIDLITHVQRRSQS